MRTRSLEEVFAAANTAHNRFVSTASAVIAKYYELPRDVRGNYENDERYVYFESQNYLAEIALEMALEDEAAQQNVPVQRSTAAELIDN
jgi:hypothetical protein